jgi:histone H4
MHSRGGAKRHRRVLRDSITGFTLPALRLIARRGGVPLPQADAGVPLPHAVLEPARSEMHGWYIATLRDAVANVEHGRRKTVAAPDMVWAVRKQGVVVYGLGA